MLINLTFCWKKKRSSLVGPERVFQQTDREFQQTASYRLTRAKNKAQKGQIPGNSFATLILLDAVNRERKNGSRYNTRRHVQAVDPPTIRIGRHYPRCKQQSQYQFVRISNTKGRIISSNKEKHIGQDTHHRQKSRMRGQPVPQSVALMTDMRKKDTSNTSAPQND